MPEWGCHGIVKWFRETADNQNFGGKSVIAIVTTAL